MLSNPIFLLIISTIFAGIPAGIWLYILFKKTESSKKTLALIFGLGCLTAPALLGLQYAWDIFPRFNLAALIQDNVQKQSTMYILMFILFGAMEEIIKHYVISGVDKKTVLIKTINDTIRYSLAAALGFSFTENIYYLYEYWPSIKAGELAGMYMFRSTFTACAHMIFSGIFGYYYAMGKFSIYISQQEKLSQGVKTSTRIIGKIFNLPTSQAYRQKMILKGLFIAIFMHATYNYLLQISIMIPVLIFVIIGYLYLRYLLKRKAGHLILSSDISEEKKSSMAKRDEDVIIELLGMWFEEKRFMDVISISERLLERDPDNQIVKIFKAKALDKMEDKKILESFVKNKSNLAIKDQSVLNKYFAEKEMQIKVKKMIRDQLKKEGKKFKETEKKKTNTRNPSKIEKGKVLDKYTKGESFNINN